MRKEQLITRSVTETRVVAVCVDTQENKIVEKEMFFYGNLTDDQLTARINDQLAVSDPYYKFSYIKEKTTEDKRFIMPVDTFAKQATEVTSTNKED